MKRPHDLTGPYCGSWTADGELRIWTRDPNNPKLLTIVPTADLRRAVTNVTERQLATLGTPRAPRKRQR